MKIPTAKDFWNNSCITNELKSPGDIMIEFARLHVKEALKAAVNNSEVRITENALIETGYCDTSYDDGVKTITCDRESILNAYPEDLIK